MRLVTYLIYYIGGNRNLERYRKILIFRAKRAERARKPKKWDNFQNKLRSQTFNQKLYKWRIKLCMNVYICVWCLGFSGIDLHGDFCAQNQALLLHCCSSFGLYLAVCPIPSSILQPGKSRRLGFLHPRQVWLSLYPPPLREQKQIRTVAAASFRSVQPNRPDTCKGKNLCWKNVKLRREKKKATIFFFVVFWLTAV